MEVINAAFSLVSYEFPNVNMQGEYRPTTETLTINFSANGEYNAENGLYNLNFSTQISGKDTNPYITVLCKAIYKFNSPIALEEIPDYFYVNSIAILFPYVRAYISLLTTQANQKAVILPTYNLSSLASQLKKNTTV